MTTSLESDLRDAFGVVAVTTPLEHVVVRGRRLRRRRRIPAYVSAVSVLTAGALLAVTLIAGHDPASAFTTWTAHPAMLRGTQKQVDVGRCKKIAGVGSPTAEGQANSLSAPVVEGRGRFSFVVLTDGHRAADCFAYAPQPPGVRGRVYVSLESSSHPIETVGRRETVTSGAASIAVEDAQAVEGTDNEGHNLSSSFATDLWGWTAPDVATVQITSVGLTVDASVHDGVFAAWWPTTADAVPASIIRAYDARGQLVGTTYE